MSDLSEKIIIITGGNGLLGREIVSEIANKNGRPINFDLEINPQFESHIVDITNNKALHSAVKKVYDTYGRIDGLVNNAYPRTRDWGVGFEEDEELVSWSRNVDLQLNSYVACCQEVLPYMKKKNAGSIVNIASIYGVVGNDFTIYENTDIKVPAPYSAIKGGLINFSRYLASFYGKHNIRINCLSPGGVFDNQHPIFVENYEHKVPMKRMGNPTDIAPPTVFLLSEDAKYITGQNLIVDGGWTAI